MSSDLYPLPPLGQKHTFIRDGALILYFDKTETPFVARFDLDSLAQASFEVIDKKDGLYSLTLRDYSGEPRSIAQFGSKNDAHQALYEILQALLSRESESVDPVIKSKSCGSMRFFIKLLKWILVLAVVVYVVLAAAQFFFAQGPLPVQKAQISSNSSSGISALPEGQAVDADSVLSPDFNSAPVSNPAAE